MYQNVFGSDGQIHLENQVGCQRFDLTTGEAEAARTDVPYQVIINMYLMEFRMQKRHLAVA